VLHFPQFRAFAVKCLERAWPSSIKCRTVSCKWKEFAADTVTLARAYDVPSILKRPLYELLITPGFKIASTDKISSDDMHLLATAREQLCAIWHTTIAEEMSIEPSTCSKHKPKMTYEDAYSSSRVFHIQHKKHAITTMTAYLMDPISGFDAILQLLPKPYDDSATSWCLKCIDEKQTSLNNRSMEIWDTLDQWLGLKGEVTVQAPT